MQCGLPSRERSRRTTVRSATTPTTTPDFEARRVNTSGISMAPPVSTRTCFLQRHQQVAKTTTAAKARTDEFADRVRRNRLRHIHDLRELFFESRDGALHARLVVQGGVPLHLHLHGHRALPERRRIPGERDLAVAPSLGINNAPAQAVPWTSDTGHSGFFSANNIELVIKPSTAGPSTSTSGSSTARLSASSHITVTDTVTGAVKTYTNRRGISRACRCRGIPAGSAGAAPRPLRVLVHG